MRASPTCDTGDGFEKNIDLDPFLEASIAHPAEARSSPTCDADRATTPLHLLLDTGYPMAHRDHFCWKHRAYLAKWRLSSMVFQLGLRSPKRRRAYCNYGRSVTKRAHGVGKVPLLKALVFLV